MLRAALSDLSIDFRVEDDAGSGPTVEFQTFMDTYYAPFVVDALESIRMFGFVVFGLRRKRGMIIPHVAPFDTYRVELVILSGYECRLRATSTLTASTSKDSRLYTYMNSCPTMQGIISSPIAALVPKISSLSLLLSAAVQNDLNAALPTLITENSRNQVPATREDTFVSDLEGMFGTGATEIVESREVRCVCRTTLLHATCLNPSPRRSK